MGDILLPAWLIFNILPYFINKKKDPNESKLSGIKNSWKYEKDYLYNSGLLKFLQLPDRAIVVG